jgi:hypothetical protein
MVVTNSRGEDDGNAKGGSTCFLYSYENKTMNRAEIILSRRGEG